MIGESELMQHLNFQNRFRILQMEYKEYSYCKSRINGCKNQLYRYTTVQSEDRLDTIIRCLNINEFSF